MFTGGRGGVKFCKNFLDVACGCEPLDFFKEYIYPDDSLLSGMIYINEKKVKKKLWKQNIILIFEVRSKRKEL